jgi:ArsR family transcriptional regulator
MMTMEELLGCLKAVAEETRLKILKLLEEGELCVCDMVAAFDMVQPKISFHLAVLKDAGLVQDRRQGKWSHYRIEPKDLFRRFLLATVLERFPADAIASERRRLSEFREAKTQCRPQPTDRTPVGCPR